jgi:hypothetical protein
LQTTHPPRFEKGAIPLSNLTADMRRQQERQVFICKDIISSGEVLHQANLSPKIDLFRSMEQIPGVSTPEKQMCD